MKQLFNLLLCLMLLMPSMATAAGIDLAKEVEGHWIQMSKNDEVCPDDLIIVYRFDSGNESCLSVTKTFVQPSPNEVVRYDVIIIYHLYWHIVDGKIVIKVDAANPMIDIDAFAINDKLVYLSSDKKEEMMNSQYLKKMLKPLIDEIKANSNDVFTNIILDDESLYFTDKNGNQYEYRYIQL